MPEETSNNTKNFPNWVVPALIVVAVLMLGFIFFRSPATQSPPAADLPITETEEQHVLLSLVTPSEIIQYNINISEEMTVEELLAQAEEQHGLEVQYSDSSFGTFVEKLADLPNESTSGHWLFSINEEASPVGISEAMVGPGDTLTWTFEE